MGKEKYAVGIDFGTLSGRAVLARLSDGEILAQSALAYRHGVYEETLPDGTKAPAGWALQDPADSLEVLFHTMPEILKAGTSPPAPCSRWTKGEFPSAFRRNIRTTPMHTESSGSTMRRSQRPTG